MVTLKTQAALDKARVEHLSMRVLISLIETQSLLHDFNADLDEKQQERISAISDTLLTPAIQDLFIVNTFGSHGIFRQQVGDFSRHCFDVFWGNLTQDQKEEYQDNPFALIDIFEELGDSMPFKKYERGE